MSQHDASIHSGAYDEVPMARPFYPKALACFMILALCLGWLVSLQTHTQALANAQPAAPNAAGISKQSPAPTPKPINPRPAAPNRQLTDTDFALAEIDLLQELVQEDPAVDFRKIVNALVPYTYSLNTAIRDTAIRVLGDVKVTHDKVALKFIADSITEAQTRAENKDFAGAISLLKTTLEGLPEDASWSASGPDKKLNDMITDYERRRGAERGVALKGLEEALRKKEPAAGARLKDALNHADASIRSEAKAIEGRLVEESTKEAASKQSLDRTAREEWVRFFKRFGGTVAEGDFTGAAELIEQPPFEAILKGGVSDPERVLRFCAADITAIRNVYDEAIKDARGLRKQVSFHLRKGGQASGTLVGTSGQMLRIMPSKGAEIGVKITDLPAEGVRSILDSGVKKKPSVALALAALEAYENPAEAQTIITTAYERAREPLPLHWAERFNVERTLQRVQAAEEKLAALKKVVGSDNTDDVKAALIEARSAAKELEASVGLTPENKSLMEKAEKITAKKELSTVLLQNGKSPDAGFRGINTDQISDYRESLRRTDVGVGYGLKLGASGGLQRALVKFDGLEAAIGNGRVRKATLQLYQIDSPQYLNAAIGVFRLKRQWIPDSGSWMSYDGQRDHDWAIPGASGEADIEPKEDAKVVLDRKANQWRSWDVTKYVQDVMAGKAQNNGMLMKVLNGEPDFHVRFYPESDLDRAKDSNLRPKLILEITRDAE